MKEKKNWLVALAIVLAIAVVTLSFASSLIVSNVDAENLAPGQEGKLTIYLKNNLNYDAQDVSLSLDFLTSPISPVDSSESSLDEINEGDKESFAFLLKAGPDAKAGDYNIKYTITYTNTSSYLFSKTGMVSVRVSAEPELSFSVNAEKPIVGEKSRLTLKIVNKGLGEARFVSAQIVPDGFTLLSDSSIYFGSIDSDDFNTANFDVIFKSKNAFLKGTLEYSDIDNVKKTKTLLLPIDVYTRDEAVKEGIVAKSNTLTYVLIVLILVVLYIIYRAVKKRRRLQKSREAMNENRK